MEPRPVVFTVVVAPDDVTFDDPVAACCDMFGTVSLDVSLIGLLFWIFGFLLKYGDGACCCAFSVLE